MRSPLLPFVRSTGSLAARAIFVLSLVIGLPGLAAEGGDGSDAEKRLEKELEDARKEIKKRDIIIYKLTQERRADFLQKSMQTRHKGLLAGEIQDEQRLRLLLEQENRIMRRNLLFPGAGQMLEGERRGFAWGILFVGALAGAYRSHQQTQRLQQSYRDSVLNPITYTQQQARYHEAYNRTNLWLAGAMGIYGVSVVDAAFFRARTEDTELISARFSWNF